MIASDWNSGGPSPSTSAGSTICGLTLAIGLHALHVGVEIDSGDVGREALEIERDTHAKTRKRPPEGKELHDDVLMPVGGGWCSLGTACGE